MTVMEPPIKEGMVYCQWWQDLKVEVEIYGSNYMRKEIVLIGTIGVGKSTVAALLSQRLHKQLIPLDMIRWYFYLKNGYDFGKERELRANPDFMNNLYKYWKPFEADLVEKSLAEFTDCIFDFGAGHSVYEDRILFEKVEKVLEPFANVVLLVPSHDVDESVRILKERHGEHLDEFITRHFLTQESNMKLAKIVIPTGTLSPSEICSIILEKVSL